MGKCKDCVKEETANRYKENMKDPVFAEAEKARGREKYHRLQYKDKHKTTPEKKKEIMERYYAKYPESRKAKNLTQHIKKEDPAKQLHHWSYNDEHLKDVIELSVEDHNTAHRFLVYDQEEKMYRDLDGNILPTREDHEEYLDRVFEYENVF